MQLVSLSDVVVGERQRTSIDTTQLGELKQSIRDRGLFHPPTMTLIEDKLHLVMGERRFRAIESLAKEGIAIRHNGETLALGVIPYNLLSDAGELESFVAELEENIVRVDLSWQDKTRALAKLHEMRKALNPAQTQKDTATEIVKKLGGESASPPPNLPIFIDLKSLRPGTKPRLTISYSKPRKSALPPSLFADAKQRSLRTRSAVRCVWEVLPIYYSITRLESSTSSCLIPLTEFTPILLQGFARGPCFIITMKIPPNMRARFLEPYSLRAGELASLRLTSFSSPTLNTSSGSLPSVLKWGGSPGAIPSYGRSPFPRALLLGRASARFTRTTLSSTLRKAFAAFVNAF